MAQSTELFDKLVEKAKDFQETLAKLPHFMVIESRKRASDGASRRPPKRGRDT